MSLQATLCIAATPGGKVRALSGVWGAVGAAPDLTLGDRQAARWGQGGEGSGEDVDCPMSTAGT